MKNEKWTQVSTNKLVAGKRANAVKTANIVKNVTRRTYEELEKASKESFKIKQEREENLLQAFEDKKLKSKALIKEAKTLKKTKEKADKAAAKKEE